MLDPIWIIITGLAASVLNGAVMPLFGMILGFTIGSLGKLDYMRTGKTIEGESPESALKEIDRYIIAFCVLAVGSFFTNALQFIIFSYVGENYTYTLRYNYFRRVLYQDMAYFDLEENTPGAISDRLSTQCKSINSLVSTYLGSICQSICSFFIGIGIAFIFSWRIALVALGISPLLFLSGIVESKIGSNLTKKDKKTTTENSILPDTLNNMKLVRSLNAKQQLVEKYSVIADQSMLASRKGMFKRAFLLGFSQFGMFFVYALLFFIGAVFRKKNGLSYQDLMIAMFSVIFGSYGAGMANQFLGNLPAAQRAAKLILGELN